MANIRAYLSGSGTLVSSGSFTSAIDCGICYIGGNDSSATPFIIKVDTAGWQRGYASAGPYVIDIIDYDTGSNAAYRLASGATSTGLASRNYGDSLTLNGNITTAGTTIWVQKKGLSGTPIGTSATRAQISLPQDGIAAV